MNISGKENSCPKKEKSIFHYIFYTQNIYMVLAGIHHYYNVFLIGELNKL